MTTASQEYSSVNLLSELLSKRVALQQAVDDLRRNRWVGTVGFFDLVGSTGYRIQQGQDAGLEKTHRHNICVSTTIREHGGEVVKWLGDGVLARFDEVSAGPGHAYKMFQAAVAVIRALHKLNHDEGRRTFEEIHTKVGLCSGAFHYVAMTEALTSQSAAEASQGNGNGAAGAAAPAQATALPTMPATVQRSILDPIGTAVDLASRLGSLANADVIVVDDETFWGFRLVDEPAKIHVDVRGLTASKPADIAWKKFVLPYVRTTVYLPSGTAMIMDKEGLKICQLSQAAKERFTPEELKKLIDDAGLEQTAVYVSAPIKCNVKGFAVPRKALGISLTPNPTPIFHAKYESPTFDSDETLKRAEALFRAGERLDDALEEFMKVWRADNRHFHANVRLAMLYRAKRKNDEALKHLMLAKESDGSCALVWASAGVIHLDNYITGSSSTETSEESITRAIVGLTKARNLARDLFHGLLEQYTTCLLAIVYLLRDSRVVDPETSEDDYARGVRLTRDLERWPAKNRIVVVIRDLALAFQAVVRPSDPAKKEAAAKLDALSKQIDALRGKENGQEPVGGFDYDTLVTGRDMNNLLAYGKYILSRE